MSVDCTIFGFHAGELKILLLKWKGMDAIGQNLLPEQSTMPELRQLHETVLPKNLDPRNFQRKMLEMGVVKRLAERKHGVPHRAPYLYRFRTG